MIDLCVVCAKPEFRCECGLHKKTPGDMLRERREELGLSQDELAEETGYSSGRHIRAMELGSRNVSQRVLKSIELLERLRSYGGLPKNT